MQVQSMGACISAYNDCMLFNNPNSHRTVESFMTCSENGRDLFRANLYALCYGKLRGTWTKEHFFWQAWNQSLHKVWETTMNTQRPCGRMSEITENWPNTAVYGHMERYNKSNYFRQTRTKCLNTTHFSYNHSSAHKSANLPIILAIAGQRTVRSLLVLNDAHNPFNNPTVQIADPRKQNTLLSGNFTPDRRTILHHDGDICSYKYTPF